LYFRTRARYCWRFFVLLLVLLVPLVEVAPLVEAAAFVEALNDWSPVELLVELESDWSPVVALVLLVTDWSPVDVVLSIVRLERPRRSISGEKVEVEPVTVFELSAVEPVIEDWDEEVEPVIVALVPAAADAERPAFVPVAAAAFVPAVEAWLSGMQSWWTGLAECSPAFPVALSASLPACGWPSWLHSGFEVAVAPLVAFVPRASELVPLAAALVALVLLVAFDVVSLMALLLVWASTGVAARTAAAIRLMVNFGFMKCSSVAKNIDMLFWDTQPRAVVASKRKNPVPADTSVDLGPHSPRPVFQAQS